MDNLQTQQQNVFSTRNDFQAAQNPLSSNGGSSLQDSSSLGGQNLSALPREGLSVIPNCTTNCVQSQPAVAVAKPWSAAQWAFWSVLFVIVFVVMYKLFSRGNKTASPVAQLDSNEVVTEMVETTTVQAVVPEKTTTPKKTSKKSTKKAKRKKRH